MTSSKKAYGFEDASFIAAGGEEGIKKLVGCFYKIMHDNQDYHRIYYMHPEDISVSIDKLARFLCGWLGGPRLYQEKYGSINIPQVHGHLDIGVDERDQWLSCMQQAVDEQEYDRDFKEYLIAQLSVPANFIVRRCQNNKIKN